MFNLKEKFKFLEDGIDFPFYNDIPKLSTWEWAILVIAVIILALEALFHWIPQPYSFALYFLLMVVPAIYICKGDYGLFFKKPKLGDIKTIIICFVLYVIYAGIVGFALYHLGVPLARDSAVASNFSLSFIAGLFFQLVGEEFFKVFILLIVMYLVYRVTNNRNMAIGVGIVVTLFTFGIAHIGAYGSLLQVLLIQGLGAIFNLYAYMKTKNVVISFIVHLLIDLYGYFAQISFHAMM